MKIQDKLKIQRKKYRKTHKKEIREYQKIYRKTHKKELQRYFKKYNREHRKELTDNSKRYNRNHKHKIRKFQRNYTRIKRKININFKLAGYLRSRIWFALKGNIKSKSTLKLIGCSIKELKKYLKKQFKQGMNWSNYGINGWVIDHIRPCASFDLSKPEEQFVCFNYTNLQPLWDIENRIKGNKIIE